MATRAPEQATLTRHVAFEGASTSWLRSSIFARKRTSSIATTEHSPASMKTESLGRGGGARWAARGDGRARTAASSAVAAVESRCSRRRFARDKEATILPWVAEVIPCESACLGALLGGGPSGGKGAIF